MSNPFPGICGASYELDNRYAAIERTVNFYVQPNESSTESKFKTMLNPCPGNAPFSPLPVPAPFNQPNRGLLELRGQVFGVNGTQVFRIDSAGVFHPIGIVASDGKPCSMVANGTGQVFIASAGGGYVIPRDGADHSLIILPQNENGFDGAAFATFQDGYILVVTPNSNQIQISGSDSIPLGEAQLWVESNVSVQAGQADYLRAIISSREYVWLLGHRRSQVYYNVGNNGLGNFPFQSYNETFIETGIGAAFSLAEMGDSLIWIGEDTRGQRACWRAASFAPERISNFAVERFWQEYARVDDAVAFPFIWKGHLFYQVTFPSAYAADPVDGFPLRSPANYHSATWLYDATSSALMGRPIWTERSYQTAMGYAEGRSERFHCFCFGRHLVGSTGVDGNPGAIYQYSDGPGGFADCGTDIDGTQVQQALVRTRVTPHTWSNNNRIIVNRLQLELSRGVGLDGAPVVGADPQIYLEISRDGGNTWGPQLNASVGKIGQYGTRVVFNRLGYGRDLVFRLTYSDPTYMSIVGGELDAYEAGN